MKRIISILLAVCLMAACIPSAGAAFPDIKDDNTALAASVLASMGVVSGYEDGSFRPDASLTRAEFCKLVIVMMGLEDKADAAARGSVFSDVKSSEWFAGYVNLAAKEGLVNGKGDGRFAPSDSITLGEAVTILIRILGYTSSQVGAVWPRDYVNFAADLGMSENVSCGMNEKLSRGEAALLMCNMLRCSTAAGKDYYTALGLETNDNVLLTSVGIDNVMVYLIDKGEVKTYPVDITFPADLIGGIGALLLDDDAAAGFVPEKDAVDYVDVDAAEKTSSSITGSDGITYKIPATAKVVCGNSVYSWTQKWMGVSSARLYIKRGEVYLVYVPAENSGGAVVATTQSAYSEIMRKLDVSDAALYKNGSPAEIDDLAQYDVAYYDELLGAVMVSDRKVSGFIENAYPNMSGAETITVGGSTYTLLDCASESAAKFDIGSKVTLLLTDDLKVAAVCSAASVSVDMVGLSSTDGRTVTLPGGITVRGSSVSSGTNAMLYGSLVSVWETSRGELQLSGTGTVTVKSMNPKNGTVGGYELAHGAVFYEWAGSGYAVEIPFADISQKSYISGDYIDYIHLNSAGKVDIVLFNALTGACYDYGFARFSTRGESTYLTIENGNSQNFSGISGMSVSEGDGIGLAGSNGRVADVVKLTRVSGLDVSAFYSTELMVVKNNEIAISDNVQVYNANLDSWSSSLEDVIAFAGSYTVYYDKTPSTGGQVRIIVLEK